MTAKVNKAFPRSERGTISVSSKELVHVEYIGGGRVAEERLVAERAITSRQAKLGFDKTLSPRHEVNQAAARAHGLRYDVRKKSYVDADGSRVRDKFGQTY